jgi:hypothetical protein
MREFKIGDLPITKCGECLFLMPEFGRGPEGCGHDEEIKILDMSIIHEDCPYIEKRGENNDRFSDKT